MKTKRKILEAIKLLEEIGEECNQRYLETDAEEWERRYDACVDAANLLRESN